MVVGLFGIPGAAVQQHVAHPVKPELEPVVIRVLVMEGTIVLDQVLNL